MTLITNLDYQNWFDFKSNPIVQQAVGQIHIEDIEATLSNDISQSEKGQI